MCQAEEICEQREMANELEANRVMWSDHRVLKGRRGGR